jgi:hypothetical protein
MQTVGRPAHASPSSASTAKPTRKRSGASPLRNPRAGVGVVFGQHPKPGLVVQARAVRPGTAERFRRACRYQCGQRIDADRSGVGVHPPDGRDRQHVAQAVAADRRPQFRVGALTFVAGHPGCGDLRLDSAVDQCCSQCGFGRESPLFIGDSGVVAAPGVVGPRSRYYRGAATRIDALLIEDHKIAVRVVPRSACAVAPPIAAAAIAVPTPTARNMGPPGARKRSY